MKEQIGETLRKLREEKGFTLKDMSNKYMSTSQISNIENGQIPSTHKFFVLLNKLNVPVDEFFYLMNDDYLNKRTELKRNFKEYALRKNVNGLKEITKRAETLHKKHGDIFFDNMKYMSLAIGTYFETNDFSLARKHLQPVKNYLMNVETWFEYELSLLTNCLFMFEVDDAIFFGERALKTIESKYAFYKHNEQATTLLMNLAFYCLDNEGYYHFSLKYTQFVVQLSTSEHNGDWTLYAKIVEQICHFKMNTGKYNEQRLKDLLNVYKLMDWTTEYERMERLVQKHGISLST